MIARLHQASLLPNSRACDRRRRDQFLSKYFVAFRTVGVARLETGIITSGADQRRPWRRALGQTRDMAGIPATVNTAGLYRVPFGGILKLAANTAHAITLFCFLEQSCLVISVC